MLKEGGGLQIFKLLFPMIEYFWFKWVCKQIFFSKMSIYVLIISDWSYYHIDYICKIVH